MARACGSYPQCRGFKSPSRLETGETVKTGMPNSNVLYYELENDAWLAVRPSGTEPKIKFYYGIKGSSYDEAQKMSAEAGDKIMDLIYDILEK